MWACKHARHTGTWASLLNCMTWVLKTCSHANLPCTGTCSDANIPCMLACMLVCQCALCTYMLMCQCVLRAYMLTSYVLHAYVPMCYLCFCLHMPTCPESLHASHVNMPCMLMHWCVIVPCKLICSCVNLPWVSGLAWLVWLRDHLPTCISSSVSSFNVTFFQFHCHCC